MNSGILLPMARPLPTLCWRMSGRLKFSDLWTNLLLPLSLVLNKFDTLL